ncbi:MAG: hypothetical protein EAY81_05865 [Bacteroidetes bacterium]|nr:MAG: hypothetical protein EAY81_05865 [Bacteroidota bacterium]
MKINHNQIRLRFAFKTLSLVVVLFLANQHYYTLRDRQQRYCTTSKEVPENISCISEWNTLTDGYNTLLYHKKVKSREDNIEKGKP